MGTPIKIVIRVPAAMAVVVKFIDAS